MGRSGWPAMIGCVAMVLTAATGCSSTNDSPGTLDTASPAEVKAAFCDDVGEYLAILDRYGRVFTDQTITIGEVKTDSTALEAARVEAERSTDDLTDAIAAANDAATSPSGPGGTVGTTTTVLAARSADDHQKAIAAAERELDRTLEGIDDDTPVRQVPAEVQAAAFGVEQAYVALFVDAGCLEGNPAATEALRSYVAGLQEDLTTLGHYSGAIDGLYGPATVTAVKALQASVGLPETGIVDPQTEAALLAELDARGAQQSLNIAGLQGALTVAGFYTGPIDGTWTPALEAALRAFQEHQDLPATGSLDPATLAALLGLGNALAGSATTTTSEPTATTSSSTTTTTAG